MAKIVVPVGKVQRILKECLEARNSDATLWVKYVEQYYQTRVMTGKTGKKAVLMDDVEKYLPRQEQLARARRHIQNDKNLFLPTNWKVAKRRRINEKRWREAMSSLTTHKRL